MLGVHGEAVAGPGGSTGADRSSAMVRRLLEAAKGDATGRTWTSLEDLFPLLAEAAPDAFLAAVRAGLKGDPPLLLSLFTDAPGTDSIFGPNSPHTGLLWALENLAWSPDHFGAAVDVLARLDEIDPGGRLTNRPFNSLAAIFCSWHPDNSVSSDRRLEAIDGLRERHPQCAWRLVLSMLPELHGVHFPTHEPRFRDWKVEHPVTNGEYFSLLAELVGRAIRDAGNDAGRWVELVERATHLPPGERARVVDALASVADEIPLKDRPQLWQRLRRHIGKHREYADAAWALPADEVDRLDAMASKLAPVDSYSTNAWLFTSYDPHIGRKRGADYTAYQAELGIRRANAVAAIYEESGLDGVRRLAAESVVAWGVGVAFADAVGAVPEPALEGFLSESAEASDRELAHAYFARRFEAAGWDWLDGAVGREDLSAEQKARLLAAARDYPRAWETAETLGEDVASGYWRLFSPMGLGQDFPYVEFVVGRLMSVGRFAASLRLCDLYARREQGGTPSAQLVAEALEGLLGSGEADSEIGQLAEHDFQELFDLLERNADAVGRERIAALEWAFLPALGFEPEVPSLDGHLADNPAFFVEVVSAVYRAAGDDGNDEGLTDDERIYRERRATNAYRLLSSWARPPGLIDEGGVDSEAFKRWVNEARRLLEDADRLAVGDVHIGHMLVSVPAGPGERWPPPEIRDLIEELQSDDLDAGIETELVNRRGVTSRGLEEGGAQERDLATRYKEDAEHVASRWPRTAAILRAVAESYESWARMNEDSAERFRRGLDR